MPRTAVVGRLSAALWTHYGSWLWWNRCDLRGDIALPHFALRACSARVPLPRQQACLAKPRDHSDHGAQWGLQGQGEAVAGTTTLNDSELHPGEAWAAGWWAETQRYWIAFRLSLNQAVSPLISSEKWPLGLTPFWSKLLINPRPQAPEQSGLCEDDSLFCHYILRPHARIRSIDMVIALIKLSVLIPGCAVIAGSRMAPASPWTLLPNTSLREITRVWYFSQKVWLWIWASTFSAVNSRNPPSGTPLDLLSILRKKNWLILKLNVGICCYSKPGPWLQ